MNVNRPKAFALIELMVVVAVLSVAAALFVPKFLRHQIQKKQEECHRNLRSLLTSEREFFKSHGVFTTDLSSLGWKPEGRGWHAYHFPVDPPPKNGFVFECTGNIDKDPTLDRATIDGTGRINQISDDARQ